MPRRRPPLAAPFLRATLSVAALATLVTGLPVRAQTAPAEAPAEAAPAEAAPPVAAAPTLAFEKYTLPNGLEVVLHQDPRQPQVTVDVWYHVGAVDEVPGKTGFAHLFEHLMFQGSKHIPGDQHFKRLEEVGAAIVNGTTNFDRTNYFETVPRHELELALWLESDRMGWLMEAVQQATLDEQREVVKNERRQGIDSRAYGVAQEKLWQAVFPANHPYHGAVIGSMQDLDRASMDDVARFYDDFYAPSNATVAIVGDFDVATTKKLVEKYFGSIPSWPKPKKNAPFTPTINSPIRVDHEETVGVLPYVQVMWLVPARNQPHDVELEVLASILGDGVASKMQQALMVATEQVQYVRVEMDAMGNVGVFSIEAMVRDGVDPQLVLDSIQSQLGFLNDLPITPEEVERARKKIRTARTFNLEMGFRRAETLQEFNHFDGDPGGLSRYLERLDKVTDQSVMEALNQHLNPEHRAVVVARPKGAAGGETEQAAAEAAAAAAAEEVSQ